MERTEEIKQGYFFKDIFKLVFKNENTNYFM